MASGTIKLDTLTVASSDNVTYSDSNIGTVTLYTNGLKHVHIAVSDLPITETDVAVNAKYAPAERVYFVGMNKGHNLRFFQLILNSGSCRIRAYASSQTGAYLDVFYV